MLALNMLIYAQVNSAISGIASLKLASVLQFLTYLHEFPVRKFGKFMGGGKFVGEKLNGLKNR